MPKKTKSQDNLDPFAKLLNPFKNQAAPQARPRKRAGTKRIEDTNLKLSVVVQRERMERGWTQRDLAERANVGLRQVSELERGKVNFTYQTLTRILAVLGYELTPQPITER